MATPTWWYVQQYTIGTLALLGLLLLAADFLWNIAGLLLGF